MDLFAAGDVDLGDQCLQECFQLAGVAGPHDVGGVGGELGEFGRGDWCGCVVVGGFEFGASLLEAVAAAVEVVDAVFAGVGAEVAGFEGVEVAVERGLEFPLFGLELVELDLAAGPVGVQFRVGLGDRLFEQRRVVQELVESVEDGVFELLGGEVVGVAVFAAVALAAEADVVAVAA